MNHHTKGKWKMLSPMTSAANVSHRDRLIIFAGETEIAMLPGSKSTHGVKELSERLSNGFLMAASPNMFEVLETIENDKGQVPHWLWLRIKKVIKEAKGEK